MARTSAAIGELVKKLDLEPSERVDVQGRVARYNRDCGCAVGGVFMVAALLAVIAYLAYLAVDASFAIAVVGAGIAFVFLCSLLGKAVGLAVASLRLELLRRSLSRRSRRLEGDDRVFVH